MDLRKEHETTLRVVLEEHEPPYVVARSVALALHHGSKDPMCDKALQLVAGDAFTEVMTEALDSASDLLGRMKRFCEEETGDFILDDLEAFDLASGRDDHDVLLGFVVDRILPILPRESVAEAKKSVSQVGEVLTKFDVELKSHPEALYPATEAIGRFARASACRSEFHWCHWAHQLLLGSLEKIKGEANDVR